MYTPSNFKMNDNTEMIDFIHCNSFGTIITHNSDDYFATHLPFVIYHINGTIKLYSHFARANNHWQQTTIHPSILIFLGHHYYVSPQFYDTTEHVPTWNYTSVHIHAKGQVVEDEAKSFKLMRTLIQNNEDGFLSEWDKMSPEYRKNMIKRIVWIEFEVSKMMGKKKLSQKGRR